MPVRRVLERIRLQKLKREHKKYLEERGIKPINEFWRLIKEYNEELHNKMRADIEEMHKNYFKSLLYRPSDEENAKLQRYAEFIHNNVARGVNPQHWEAIITHMPDYEEPYKTLGKLLLKLWLQKKREQR